MLHVMIWKYDYEKIIICFLPDFEGNYFVSKVLNLLYYCVCRIKTFPIKRKRNIEHGGMNDGA